VWMVFLQGSFRISVGFLSIFDMYKGVLVSGYTRVCNHVNVRI